MILVQLMAIESCFAASSGEAGVLLRLCVLFFIGWVAAHATCGGNVRDCNRSAINLGRREAVGCACLAAHGSRVLLLPLNAELMINSAWQSQRERRKANNSYCQHQSDISPV
jgi:hypothetical protein